MHQNDGLVCQEPESSPGSYYGLDPLNDAVLGSSNCCLFCEWYCLRAVLCELTDGESTLVVAGTVSFASSVA
jgi:hypothetical protein